MTEPNFHVVGCGLPRTGTTTLRAALKMMGFSKELIHVGDHIALGKLYKNLDKRHPNAKFIMTHRESAETWLQSVEKRTAVIKNDENILRNREALYGSRDIIPDQYKAAYMDWNIEVMEYFGGKYGDEVSNRLLPVCWSNSTPKGNWTLLSWFLGIDAPDEEFPHRNKSIK